MLGLGFVVLIFLGAKLIANTEICEHIAHPQRELALIVSHRGELIERAPRVALDIGAAFTELFQVDRFTGRRKGILSLSIDTDPVVARRMRP